MSKLGNFLGSPKEIEIEGLGKIKVYPLKVKDMKIFKKDMSNEEQIEMSKEIIKRSLQDEKDITDEEIDSLPLQTFTEIMDAINDVNGFNENESAINKIKSRIKQ